MTISHRPRRYIAAVALTIALAVTIAFIGGSVLANDSAPLPYYAAIVVIPLFTAAAILACIPWWRALDEMQRARQLKSWYWGGSFGNIVGIIGAASIGGALSPMAQGAMLVAAGQTIGFTLFWLASPLFERRGS
jgi:hypothetical protein